MAEHPPVTDWDTDFDVLDPAYVTEPFGIWDQLRRDLSGGPYRSPGQHLAAHPIPGRRRPGP